MEHFWAKDDQDMSFLERITMWVFVTATQVRLCRTLPFYNFFPVNVTVTRTKDPRTWCIMEAVAAL